MNGVKEVAFGSVADVPLGKGINKDSLPTSHLDDSPLAFSLSFREIQAVTVPNLCFPE